MTLNIKRMAGWGGWLAGLFLATGGAHAELNAAAGSTAAVADPGPNQVAAQSILATPDFHVAYAMSGGRRLDVERVGRALLATYGRHAPVMLYPDSQGRFVSPDGRLALRFELDDAGYPRTAHMTMPALGL